MKPSQMYAGDWCGHHARDTRPVGRPGTPEERQQCDECEAEFLGAVVALARKDVA